MSTATLGNNLLNSLTGQVEKAYIEIIDKREKEVTVTQVKKDDDDLLGGFGSINDIDMDDMDLAGINLDNIKGLSTTRKRYIVQFNPSTLNIQAMGGGQFAVTNHAAKGKSKLDYTALTPRIQVSMKLIFDEVQRPVLQSKDDSVRTQVEAFVAALRNPKTREITFAWGKLCYSGDLISVDSRYTMFSVYGKPLRAEVTVTLVCKDENLQEDNMGIWEEHYKKAFKEEEIDLTSFGQKIGNLVKINL